MRIYLVCYDITDDDTRLEVSKILGEYGERVQRSVFEVAIRSEAELEWLRARLEEALGGDTPELRFYPLCGRCRARRGDQSAHRTRRS
jgi:CRISPR-associated protein Cas2